MFSFQDFFRHLKNIEDTNRFQLGGLSVSIFTILEIKTEKKYLF